MEGSTKYNIPLDSELDINSHDMLVSVQQPKFLYNRQRFLGSLLTSSVRYEHEGWIAGWWAHEFFYKADETNKHKLYENGELVDEDKYKIYVIPIKHTKYYKLLYKEFKVSILLEDIINWSIGSGTVDTDIKREYTTIIGKTNKGDDFKAQVNLIDNTAVVLEGGFTAQLYKNNFEYSLNVLNDPDKSHVTILSNLDPEYQYKDKLHIWYDGKFIYDGINVSSTNTNIHIQSVTKDDNKLTVEYKDESLIPVNIDIYKKDFWYSGQFISIDGTKFLGNIVDRPEHQITHRYVIDETRYFQSKKPLALIETTIPLWLKIYANFDYIAKELEIEEQVEGFDYTIKKTDVVLAFRWKRPTVSLHDMWKDKDLGAEWQMYAIMDLVDNSNRDKYKWSNDKISKSLFDTYQGPFKLNPNFKPNEKVTTGNKFEYIANFSFNWTKKPSDTNPTFRRNHNYVVGGTDEGNLPWLVAYAMPAVIPNKDYDITKPQANGDKYKYIANLDFDVTEPINMGTMLQTLPDLRNIGSEIVNPDYDPAGIKKGNWPLIKNPDYTDGGTDEGNMPWIYNTNYNVTLGLGANGYFNWYDDNYMCTIKEVESNIPFILNPQFDYTKDVFRGEEDKELPNLTWSPYNNEPRMIKNLNYLPPEVLGRKKANWPWVKNPNFKEHLLVTIGNKDIDILKVPLDIDSIVNKTFTEKNKLYKYFTDVQKWHKDIIWGKQNIAVPNFEYVPNYKNKTQNNARTKVAFARGKEVGIIEDNDNEIITSDFIQITGASLALEHGSMSCTFQIQQRCLNKNKDNLPIAIGENYALLTWTNELDDFLKDTTFYDYYWSKTDNSNFDDLKNKPKVNITETKGIIGTGEEFLAFKRLVESQVTYNPSHRVYNNDDVINDNYIYTIYIIDDKNLVAWKISIVYEYIAFFVFIYVYKHYTYETFNLIKKDQYLSIAKIKNPNKFNFYYNQNLDIVPDNSIITNIKKQYGYNIWEQQLIGNDFWCLPLCVKGKTYHYIRYKGNSLYENPRDGYVIEPRKEPLAPCWFINKWVTLQTFINNFNYGINDIQLQLFLDKPIFIGGPLKNSKDVEILNHVFQFPVWCLTGILESQYDLNSEQKPYYMQTVFTQQSKGSIYIKLLAKYNSKEMIQTLYSPYNISIKSSLHLPDAKTDWWSDDINQVQKIVEDENGELVPFDETIHTSVEQTILQKYKVILEKNLYIEFEYDIMKEEYSAIEQKDDNTDFDIVSAKYTDDGIKVELQKVTVETIDLLFTLVKDAIGDCAGVEMTLQQNGILNLKLFKLDLAQQVLADSPNYYIYKVDNNIWYIVQNNLAKLSFIPKGALSGARQNDLGITFNDIYKIIINKKVKNYLDYKVTDIRNNRQKTILRRNIDDINMYLKQMWSNTFEVENYWWWDSSTIVRLTQNTVDIMQKLNTIHDWDADNWKIKHTFNRTTVLKANDLKYFVTSAFNDKPCFVKLQNHNGKLRLLYSDLSFNFKHIDLALKHNNFGQAPNKKYLSTYSKIKIGTIISEAKFSSTVVQGHLLVGIAYTKGLDQWTIDINLVSGQYSVFYGYGYVSNNGTLTGGQIPMQCLNEYGFKEAVHNITSLKGKKAIPNACYSNGKKIYFIYNQIQEICTHVLFNDKFIPVGIRLNNNYTSHYASTTQYYGAEYNAQTNTLELRQNIPSGFNNQFLNINTLYAKHSEGIIYKHIWYLLCSFINHSCGMYSYVWYNSNYEDIKKPSSDIIVYKKEHKKEISADPYNFGFYYRMMISTLDNQGEIARVTEYNPNQFEEKVETDGLFYKANIDGIIANNTKQSGLMAYMSSTIVEMATLDMFYSIDDRIQCYAGPGFVEHKFVAQCYAQSVTDLQLDLKHIDYLINFLESISKALEASITVMQAVYQIAADTAAIVAQTDPIVATNKVPAAAIGAAITIGIAGTILQVAIGIATMVKCYIDAIIEAFGLKQTKAHIQSTLIKYKLDIEGKHAYGQRSLELMYPAFGAKGIKYTNEIVSYEPVVDKKEIKITGKDTNGQSKIIDKSSGLIGFTPFTLDDPNLNFVQIKCVGQHQTEKAPDDIAIVEGTTHFLHNEPFVDKNIGVSKPVFAQPIVHDYIINEQWNLGLTALGGEIISITHDDTKILDGAPSNIIITEDFCGIASSYTAIEVKNYFDDDYLRPVAMTPTALALNINRMNCVHEAKAYHAFDGYSNRIISWKGDAGMDKEYLFQQYLFQQNDHFKRSNIFPPSQFMGSFIQKPTVDIDSEDKIINSIQSNMQEEGIINDTPGEQKNLARFAIPVHSEPLSSLPAMVRMLQPYKLHVVEGITSLCTDIRSTQTVYKAPTSIDFNINGEPFRATEEFICQLNADAGIVAVKDVVATEGLRFVGATTEVAYFYSPATRMYYAFTGARTITKQDIIYRFKDLKEGKWDFINQEVLLKVLLADDTGKVLIVRLDGLMRGELYPPEFTLYDKESDFKTLSMPAGFVYQGPRRFSVHRFVITENMFSNIIANKKKWTRLDRDKFYSERDYGWEYEDLDTEPIDNAVKGWTHNPFKLATAMLGINEETDCKFEWSITFAWTFVLEQLYEQNEYVTVCLQGETVTEGGTVLGEVTHVPLYKECFTRAGDAGYFTFQFQSGNGIGNRERLYLWCDGVIAVESIQLDCKEMTIRRTQPLYTQVDTQDLIEQ